MKLLQGIHSQFKQVIQHASQRAGVWWAPLLLFYGLLSLFIALKFSQFIRLGFDDFIINPPFSLLVYKALTGTLLFQWLISSLCITFGFLDTFFRIWEWDRSRTSDQKRQDLLRWLKR